MPLQYITFTGMDDHTDPDQIIDLSRQFPKVEWGMLHAPNLGGNGRFPTTAAIQYAIRHLPDSVNLSLHLCGRTINDVLWKAGPSYELFRDMCERGGRIQLNTNLTRRPQQLLKFKHLFNEYLGTRFILQYNFANAMACCHFGYQPNLSLLFDASGGRGQSPDTWAEPIQGAHCGYAGGLGPDNLADELARIQGATGKAHFWVDMEQKLRDERDRFSLYRAARCLSIAADFDPSITASGAPSRSVCA